MNDTIINEYGSYSLINHSIMYTYLCIDITLQPNQHPLFLVIMIIHFTIIDSIIIQES